MSDITKPGETGSAPPVSDRQVRAEVLEHIPDGGIVLSELISSMPHDRDRVQDAVRRLSDLGLVETVGGRIRPTEFTQKAKRIFDIR